MKGVIDSRKDDNVIHRLVFDKGGTLYVGYDFVLEALPNSRFQVTIKPLNPASLSNLQGSAKGESLHLRNLSLPEAPLWRYPEPQIVADGDTISVDLLENPRMGVKIFDIIQVASNWERLQDLELLLGSSGPPRDFLLDDVALQMFSSRLLVDGQLVSGSGGGCSGSIIWFYCGGQRGVSSH